MNASLWLTVAEVATRLGVCPKTVYDLLAPKGKLRCYRIWRSVRVRPEDLDRFLESAACEPSAPSSTPSVPRSSRRSSVPADEGRSEWEAALAAVGLRTRPAASRR